MLYFMCEGYRIFLNVRKLYEDTLYPKGKLIKIKDLRNELMWLKELYSLLWETKMVLNTENICH